MSILIGLVVAAALIYGWARASVLVAIFLTLGGLFCMAVIGLFRTGDPTLVWTAIVGAIIIWLPVLAKSRPARVMPFQEPALPNGQPLTLHLAPDRGYQIGTGIGFVLTVGGVGWMYLHDIPATLALISSRPFLTAVGFAALLGLGWGWASRQR